MTESERRNFLTLSCDRAPGKRQIKPNRAVLMNNLPYPESDDGDDFVDEGDVSSSKVSSEESPSNSSSSIEHSDEDSEDGENEAKSSEESSPSVKEEVDEPGELICTLCLNQRTVVQHDEVIQCDKCGVAVHEQCYVTETSNETDSNNSSSSTEPWFCEPCLYGLKEPPYCELCPNRTGAFKKADIGGGWVHLLCALFTPGVTFGDVERLSAISWQEVDYKLFGKKACAACTDPLLARTGIAVQCDAALCKNNFHVTCAQRLGLLVDNTEKFLQNTEQTASTSFEITADTVDPLFLACKKHANEDSVRQRKAACQKMCCQEEARMLTIKRRALNEREERKRLQFLDRHKKGLKELEGVTIAWPEHDKKRRRPLHTSPQYLDLFIEKAESVGQNREQFLDGFMRIDGASLSFVPPAVSTGFFEYFNFREEHVIPEELKKLEVLTKEVEKLREELMRLEQRLAIKGEQTTSVVDLLGDWYETLIALGAKVKKPLLLNNTERSLNAITVASSSKSSTLLEEKPSAAKSLPPNESLISLEDLDIHPCDICKKSTDQHVIVQCDECQKYYHMGCLDPPLKKMPKKSKQLGWMCSYCCASSDENESKDFDTTNSSRRLRDRSSANMKRKEEEEAENKAFQAAIREKRRPVQLRRSKATPGNTLPMNGVQAPVVAKSDKTRMLYSEESKCDVKILNGMMKNNVFPRKPIPKDSELSPPREKRKRISDASSPTPKRRASLMNTIAVSVCAAQSTARH